MEVRPIRNMVNHETNELFFDNLEIPADNLIGEEGQGFKYILTGLNAERALIAAECIGDGYWFTDKVVAYTKERVVFGRPIGQNQGVQFPIAEAHIEIEAANLMRYQACRLYDAGKSCGAEANMAKYLAAKASWEAANACIQFHGGFGFASEYDVERKFRETCLYQVAPSQPILFLAMLLSIFWVFLVLIKVSHVLEKIDIQHLNKWLGSERETVDRITPRLANSLAGVLNEPCGLVDGDIALLVFTGVFHRILCQ